MDNEEAPSWMPLIPIAEEALGERVGGGVRLGSVTQISDEGRRNLLLRCPVAEGPVGGPSSVVLKQSVMTEYSPDDPESGSAVRLLNDWASAEFLSRLPQGSRYAPRFYGGNREHGFVLLEDLGVMRSLVEPLLGSDPAEAEAALTAYAVCVGQMHADTVGRSAEYERLRTGLGPLTRSAAEESARSVRERLASLPEALALVGLEIPAGLEKEIDAAAAALQSPGPFLAFTHGDPCPDNGAYDGRLYRLFDYEFGGFRHALLDGVYTRILFPTCWCVNRLPESVWARLQTTYRTELERGCAAASDDALYRQAVLDVTAYWALMTLGGHLKNAVAEDRQWGISTTRMRLVTRMELLAATTDELGGLPAFRDLANRLLERLREWWPAEETEMPLYPAFRSGGSQKVGR